MATRSRFTPKVPQAPSGRKLSVQVVKDMRGLNSTDPYGILAEYASPFLRNVRMYLSNTKRQVAISTRQGAIEYSVPIGETNVASDTSTTNASTTSVSAVRWVAMPFTVSGNGVLTKADIKCGQDTGVAPISVRIYTDNSGEPGELLAKTTIFNSDIPEIPDYATCRFVEAPEVATATTYWIVVSVQRANGDAYVVSTNDATTLALSSNTSGNSWAAESFSINFRVYASTAGQVKGTIRYTPQSGSATTFFAHNNDVYTIDDTDGSTTSRIGSLNASATKVRFTEFDDAVFFANGYDVLQRSTGGSFSSVTGLSTVPSIVTSHKNRLWVVSAADKSRVEFSELADYDDWESTGFIYVPEPKSSDPITAIYSFQDTLVVFTKNAKYVIYGDDLATFQVRQSLGDKGAVSQEAVTHDENYLYFVSTDGHLYRWNGSKDEQLSRPIEADLDDVANFNNVAITYWDDRIYYWFQSTGQANYDANFVYETRYKEWFYDTGRFVNGGMVLDQENDRLLLTSDRAGVIYEGGQTYSDLGKPIDFEYHSNYYDFGRPDNLKQVRRLYLQFRKVGGPGPLSVGVDVDFKNDPLYEEIDAQTSGYKWGDNLIEWGDPEIFWGSEDQYLRHRMTVPGQATHYQIRVKKTCAETPVYFIGHSEHWRARRAA